MSQGYAAANAPTAPPMPEAPEAPCVPPQAIVGEDYLSSFSVRKLKQLLADTATPLPPGVTDKAELREQARQAAAVLGKKGRDGLPLNLCPGSGNAVYADGKRRIVVEADFVTCTQ